MKKAIDCLLIGHNEMEFAKYERIVRKIGVNSGAYRDLNLNFIRYNNRPYTVSEIFNIFYYQDKEDNNLAQYFQVAESFSAAIAYLGSYLDRRGYTFDYVNAFLYSKAELAEKLTHENILTIAIITTLYVTAFPIIEIIKFIRTYNQSVKIIVGGPFVSTKVRTLPPEELVHLLQSTIGADFYVNSAGGETALIKIIDAVKNNWSWEKIPNIYYRTGEGISATPVLKEDTKLSGNMVNWNLFGDRIGEHVNVRTAISCPFSCSFCGFPQHAGKYQTAGVEEVEEELRQLTQFKTVKNIHFIDDTFNVPVDRFKNLLRMMIKNKFEFKWHSYLRCQYADREMAALMKESGCEGVFLGIESGNDQILKNMNKLADTQQYLKKIEFLKEQEIVTFGNFIIGFPRETDETVGDTIRFIENSKLDFFRVQLWYCEPITPIWQQRDIYRIQGESFEWEHASMDSKRACDLIEEIFSTVKSSIWVPQYNFDFDSIWHLVHRGMSIEQIKNFLITFKLALEEKLRKSIHQEVSYGILKQLKETLSSSERNTTRDQYENIPVDGSEAEFEFI